MPINPLSRGQLRKLIGFGVFGRQKGRPQGAKLQLAGYLRRDQVRRIHSISIKQAAAFESFPYGCAIYGPE